MQNFLTYLKGKYVIGVSGGSDSMALLHMCMSEKIDVVVAHMNYHKRESANRDENIVCTFCQRYHIPYEVAIPQGKCDGNFQAYAREERYTFYRMVLQKYQCDGVLLAHQEDDVIETYLMQKQRNSMVQSYGIEKEVMLFQMHVIRPLLNYSKKALEDYCHENHVIYGVDESNLTDDYTRNYIRHHQVAYMNEEQRKQCLQQMAMDNQRLHHHQRQKEAFLKDWNQNKELLFAQENAAELLQEWIYQRCKIRLSMHHVKSLCEQLKGRKQWVQSLNSEYDLVSDYDEVHIQRKSDISYTYRLHKDEMVEGMYFTMAKEGPSTCAVTLSEEDYPIIIRNAQKSDAIILRFGTKKISRFFIDRHIPLSKRRIWPVVVNNMGEIVMIPEIGCDVKHFSNTPNLFVIK